MIRRYFILFFLLQPFFVLAQNHSRIDSLKRIVYRAKGEEKFEALNNLGFEYRLSYPDSTIYYCEQAFSLGNDLKIKRGLSKPLSFIGLANSYKGDYKSSFDYHNRAIAIAEEEGDSSQLAFGYNNFGRLFFDQGDLVRAYNNFIKAEAIFEAVDDKSGLSYVSRSLANLYKSQGDFDKALRMSLKAYNLRREASDSRGILSALMELGLVYEEVNDTINAISSLRMADSIANAIDDQISHAEINLALAEILLDKYQLSDAFKEAEEARDIIVKTGNQRLRPRVNLLLGRLYLEINNLSAAIDHLNRVITDAERTGNLLQQRDANLYLSKAFTKRKDASKAIEYTNRYLILKESLQNVDLTRQIERLQFQLEIEKKEKENELLLAEQKTNEVVIQQQKLQNVMLVIIIVFISILTTVHWRNSIKRKVVNHKLALQNSEIQKQREEIVRQNENLSRRNAELSELNHEKDTLMSIVAHDLKSPLNSIKGLIYLMETGGLNEPEQKRYLGMVKTATQGGLDLIKDILDVNMLEENVQPRCSFFDLSTFMLGKTESFKHAAGTKNIQLTITRVESEEIHSDLDYLSRIMDNLISNALKFSKENSAIELSAGVGEGNFWIKVRDQGPGFSEIDKTQLFQKFRKLSARPTGGESSNGLGLAIVKTLVDRLGGVIELNSQLGKGSEFSIVFPIHQSVIPDKAV